MRKYRRKLTEEQNGVEQKGREKQTSHKNTQQGEQSPAAEYSDAKQEGERRKGVEKAVSPGQDGEQEVSEAGPTGILSLCGHWIRSPAILFPSHYINQS